MAVKIEMDMPKSCSKCRFCTNKTEFVGTCLAIPLKDLDNEVVAFQKVDTYYGDTRSKHCPLKECTK